jgi:hypothetical protein
MLRLKRRLLRHQQNKRLSFRLRSQVLLYLFQAAFAFAAAGSANHESNGHEWASLELSFWKACFVSLYFAYFFILLFYHTFGRKEGWQMMGYVQQSELSGGRNIQSVLQLKLQQAQIALEQELAQVSLDQVVRDLADKISSLQGRFFSCKKLSTSPFITAL